MNTSNCLWCDGAGIVSKADQYGDDYEQEYCSVCDEGKRLSFFAWFRMRKSEIVAAKTI